MNSIAQCKGKTIFPSWHNILKKFTYVAKSKIKSYWSVQWAGEELFSLSNITREQNCKTEEETFGTIELKN